MLKVICSGFRNLHPFVHIINEVSCWWFFSGEKSLSLLTPEKFELIRWTTVMEVVECVDLSHKKFEGAVSSQNWECILWKPETQEFFSSRSAAYLLNTAGGKSPINNSKGLVLGILIGYRSNSPAKEFVNGRWWL